MNKKLIIQIPCLNEEDNLPITLSELPRNIDGIDTVEWLIIDDGSTDSTVKIAKKYGVDHIISHKQNRGLAAAFKSGLDFSINNNADIIVNTDADNQYCSKDIDKLVQPILSGDAEIVIGARPISEIKHFSKIKKLLQLFGSWVVRYASQTDVLDAPSGFRGISRNAALLLSVFNSYTYTLETIIQAGQNGIKTISVPIRINKTTRPSRLMKNSTDYVVRSMVTILRIFMIYRPGKSFFMLGLFPFGAGFLISLRWIILYFIEGSTRTHVPSLILASILLLIGFHTWLFGLFAELVATNRKLLEEARLRLRRLELKDK